MSRSATCPRTVAWLVFVSLLAGCASSESSEEDPDAGPNSPSDGSVADSGTTPGQPDGAVGPDGAAASDASPAPLSCDDAPLCDGFETAAAGGPADPQRWVTSSPNCSGNGEIAIDDQVARSGRQSVRVRAGGSYCDHIFIANDQVTATLGDAVYARFWLRVETALGSGHVTFLTMHDEVDGKDLRMGGQSGIVMWNRERDDATIPELSPTGIAASVPLVAGSWTCVELLVNSAGTIDTWVDGALVSGLIVDGSPTPDIDRQWLRDGAWRPQLVDFKLGWESYAGQANTLWFDDVLVANSRVGCDPAAARAHSNRSARR